MRTGKHDKVGGLLTCRARTRSRSRGRRRANLRGRQARGPEPPRRRHRRRAPAAVPGPTYPEPTFSLAVTPKAPRRRAEDRPRSREARRRRPDFHVQPRPNTGELIVSGIEPLQLEIHLGRLQRRYGVAHRHHTCRRSPTGDGRRRPRVTTATRSRAAAAVSSASATCARAEASAARASSSSTAWSAARSRGSSSPRSRRASEVPAKGGLAGFPVVDVLPRSTTASSTTSTPTRSRFQIAGERAFADAFKKARPVLLEPVMDVEIHDPGAVHAGTSLGTLSTLRGRMSRHGRGPTALTVIKAHVPLPRRCRLPDAPAVDHGG